MAISTKDLVKNLSREELLEDFVEIGTALGVPAETFEDGDPIYGLLVIFAERLAQLWNDWIVRAIQAPFLDFSRGGWLTLAASLIWETDRKQQGFATASLWVENRSLSFHGITEGLVRIRNADGKGFKSVTAGPLVPWSGSGAYPKILLTFIADEAGTGSNTPIGGILAQPASAPAGVFVQTNTAPILGQDEEADSALVPRARLSTGPLSPAGPRSAYEYIAMSTKRPDGTYVDVTRVRAKDGGNGFALVYLAGASGPTTGNMSTAGSDVFLVYTALARLVSPLGFGVLVYGATAVAVETVVELVVDRNTLLTEAEAIEEASAAITSYFQTLPIGGHRRTEGGQGYVFPSEVQAKASEAADGIISATATLDLAEDFALDDSEVAVPTFQVNATLVSQ